MRCDFIPNILSMKLALEQVNTYKVLSETLKIIFPLFSLLFEVIVGNKLI